MFRVFLGLNLITKETFDELSQRQVDEKVSAVELLHEKGISFDIIKNILYDKYDIDFYDLANFENSDDIISLINHETAHKYNVLPVKRENNTLFLAMENPLNNDNIDKLSLITNFNIIPFFVEQAKLKSLISLYYLPNSINYIESQFLLSETNSKKYTSQLFFKEEVQNSPAVKMIDYLVDSAITLKASDIHMEPFETGVRIRYRVDGILNEFDFLGISMHSYLVSRLKIMAKLDISERRLPQEGHVSLEKSGEKIDLRLAFMPTVHGEKVVIRIIYSSKVNTEKRSLGFFEDDLSKIDKILKSPNGMIIVTGPTGCGKTTTLYSFLNELNNKELNIVTIEDPVENFFYGISQIDINRKIGFDFKNALGYVLRQDPDVIMVGEIRDSETADIAIKASITGHLVLTTLHTNDAVSTIIRLVNMGIDNYLVSASVRCIISQRLVRRLCDSCKTKYQPDSQYLNLLNIQQETLLFEPCGCKECNFTGYNGRFAVYEILFLDEALIELIDNRASSELIRKYLRQKGFSFMDDCLRKHIISGNTSIDEMLRVLYSGV